MTISERERERRKSPEFRAYNRGYYAKNREKMQEKAAAKRDADRGSYRARMSAYDKDNREKRKSNSSLFHRQRCEREPWYTAFRSAQVRSQKLGREFTITMQFLSTIWTGRCALTGVAFVVNDRSGPAPKSPSLDRIDNSQGYTPANVRFVLNCVNLFKGSLPETEFRDLAVLLGKRLSVEPVRSRRRAIV